MRKLFMYLVLLVSVSRLTVAYAQNNPALLFDNPAARFTRQFMVEFEHKNRMEIYVSSISDLDYIRNMDSILTLFIQDLSGIRDSLGPATISRRVDYNINATDYKKMRIRLSEPNGGYYVFINGSPALLKLHQDTVIIHGRIPADWLRQNNRAGQAHVPHYFRIAFYLNDIDELNYLRDKDLDQKISIIREHYKGSWQLMDDNNMRLKDYPEISAYNARGYLLQDPFFRIHKSIGVQNYRDHFVPSINGAAVFAISRELVKREVAVPVEAHFTFKHNDSGNVQTQVNVFVGLSYNVTPLQGDRPLIKFYPHVSLLYLVHRSGDVYEKHSFRFGVGTFPLGNYGTAIQPAIYFNDLFKEVSPSMRLIQKF